MKLIFLPAPVMLLLVLSLITTRLLLEGKVVVVRVQQTGRVPELPALSAECYHLFLSHTWKSAQDQARPRACNDTPPHRATQSS